MFYCCMLFETWSLVWLGRDTADGKVNGNKKKHHESCNISWATNAIIITLSKKENQLPAYQCKFSGMLRSATQHAALYPFSKGDRPFCAINFFFSPGFKFHGADKKFWKYLSDDKTHFSYLKQNSVGIYFVSLENSLSHYVLMYWLTSIFESPLGKETQAKSQCFLSPFCYMVRNKWSHFAS